MRGHTGAGDEEENRKLSWRGLKWWRSISSSCMLSMPIDSMLRARVSTPPRNPESLSALSVSLPRVEFVLLEENVL
jgi:hypothetical protein